MALIGSQELIVTSTHEAESSGFSSGEWTSSVIKFVPKPEDNGKYIVCKAANEYFANHIKEDGYIINVHCKLQLVYYPKIKICMLN